MTAASRTMSDTLRLLHRAGLRYSTYFDIGCADGSAFLHSYTEDFFQGVEPVNIDVNDLYEPSLRAIQEVFGGHYWIGAITDRTGETEMTMSPNPYWSSVRPPEDEYWQRINGLSGEKRIVRTTSLDKLAADLMLKPPYLMKLDVQGAEVSVLSGADAVLRDTTVVICEADLSDFQKINARLVAADFVLYDITHLNWDANGVLGWFYPIYIKATLDVAKPRPFWDTSNDAAIMESHARRRQLIMQHNAQLLEQARREKQTVAYLPGSVGRNAPCTCGSGKKYKHCCGAHAA